MAFTLSNFDKLDQAGLTQLPKLWVYGSTLDAVATIVAANYFNDVQDRMNIGDFLFLRGSDGSRIYTVSAVTPNVTLAIFPTP